VFGSTAPPSGLSGLLRKFSFRFSENDIRHWLILLFADRVNVVEGLFADLSRGYVPNIFAEMGWRAEWKYNRQGAIKKIAIAGGLVGAGALLLMMRRKRRFARLQAQDAWMEMG
jgi:hypothetical protein